MNELSEEMLKSTVEGILANPSFARLAGALREESNGNASTPQISPDMLAKLPQIMSALAPLVQQKSEDGPKSAESGSKNDADRQRKLLAALRPYLNDRRQNTVDNILKLTEMTDLLSGLTDKK